MSCNRPDIRLNFVCNQLIAVFRKVLYRDQPEGFGPMFESYFRNALMLLVLGNPTPCSLSDFDRVFGDPKYPPICWQTARTRWWSDFGNKPQFVRAAKQPLKTLRRTSCPS